MEGGDITGFSLDVDETTSTLLQYDFVDLGSNLQEDLRREIQRDGILLYTKERKKRMEENRNDFTQGSIVKKMLKFMVPVLGALILQAMYGAVDILVVGWFGTTAGISGVSTGSNIVNLVVFTVTGLSMGITVLIGRYIGEKRNERVGKVIGGAVCFLQWFRWF